MARPNHRRWGLWGMFLRFLAIILVTFIIHMFYMGFPIDGKNSLGPEALHRTLEQEWETVGALVQDDRTSRLIQDSVTWSYRLLYRLPGLEALVQMGSTPKDGTANDSVRSAVGSLWFFFEGFYWSVHLLGLRLGVLLVSAPLFIATGLVALLDGLISRHLRSIAGGRESGFIYHRAKLMIWGSILGLWLIYLVPPLPLNPVYILPPFLLLFAVAVRISAAWFKKHL
ncbi:DUF4400 domain-containing protein [Candidatus Parcubacteria bacterium]|nr:MAG: DUF4400 domain-containing protein [Candidatus Parcubacteria bacterium]